MYEGLNSCTIYAFKSTKNMNDSQGSSFELRSAEGELQIQPPSHMSPSKHRTKTLVFQILKLENELLEVQLDRDRYFKQARRAEEGERERKELAEEYVILKGNHLDLARETELLAAKNEELSMELLNMVNAKSVLVRQMENLELASVGAKVDPKAELERIQAMIGRPRRRSSAVRARNSNFVSFSANFSFGKIFYLSVFRKKGKGKNLERTSL